jgi:predicted nucleic acid-binding Zn ribbon protein
MPGRGALDSFGTILSGLAKRLGLESRLLELRLQHDWRRIVGEPMASHTWPDQIRFKKLYLIVRNSVWMQQLTYLKPTLLAKVNDAAGTALITEIAFRVSELPAQGDGHRAAASDSSQVVTDALRTEASAHAAAVQNPELRDRLTQVIAEALSRSSS